MKKSLNKYFVPHEGNDHKPHFLREKSVLVVTSVIVVLLLASVLGSFIVRGSKFLASIQSAFLVDLANEDRLLEGANGLVMNEKLVLAAQLKANDMAEKEYFAHTSPDGTTPWHWFEEAGYNYVYAGENLAVNFTRSEDVQRAWMNSPTHRANILNNRYKEIGIATAEGYYKGKKTTFVVQMFGTPSAAMVNTAPVVAAELSTPEEPAQTETLLASNELNPQALGESIEVSTPNTEVTQTAPVVAQATTISPSENIPNTQNIQTEPEVLAAEEVPQYTTTFQRLLVNPSRIIENAYLALFVVILISLLLKIFVEIRKQHPKNIIYGVLLLILVLVFMYINQSMFALPDVIAS
jgi:hypothetical protein